MLLPVGVQPKSSASKDGVGHVAEHQRPFGRGLRSELCLMSRNGSCTLAIGDWG
jgi:hypothetical protein